MKLWGEWQEGEGRSKKLMYCIRKGSSGGMEGKSQYNET